MIRPLWLLALLLAAGPVRAENKEATTGSIPQVPNLTPVVGTPNLSLNVSNLSNLTGAPAGYVGYAAALPASQLQATPQGQALNPEVLRALDATQRRESIRRAAEILQSGRIRINGGDGSISFGSGNAAPQHDPVARHEAAPRPPEGWQQLRETLRRRGAFDGEDEDKKPLEEASGLWTDPRLLTAVQSASLADHQKIKAVPERSLEIAEAHGVPRKLAAKLGKVEGLSEAEWAALLKEAANAKVAIDESLPFSKDMTLSLELEFQLAKNIRKEDLPNDERLHNAWYNTGSLPKDEWIKVSGYKMEEIRAARPAGWDDDRTGKGSFAEMRTQPENGKYYTNTPEHLRELIHGLESVQSKMPHGFYSVHGHFGREGRDLEANGINFYRFVTTFEAQLRALAGRRWNPPKSDGSLGGGLNNLRYAPDGWSGHSHPFNLSGSYPTIEIKVIDGLAGKDGRAHFDTKALLKDLYFAFALVNRVKDNQVIPMAELGVAAIRGEKPSMVQQQRFLDLMFGDDVLGKVIALQRLAALADEAPGLSAAQIRHNASEKREVYSRLGLGVLYDIHQAAGGYDARWRQALLADNAKGLRKLAAELPHGVYLENLFPADFLPLVKLALEDAAQAQAAAKTAENLEAAPAPAAAAPISRWRYYKNRVVNFIFDLRVSLLVWLDRMLGGPVPTEPRSAGAPPAPASPSRARFRAS